jgi:hypothetical protein
MTSTASSTERSGAVVNSVWPLMRSISLTSMPMLLTVRVGRGGRARHRRDYSRNREARNGSRAIASAARVIRAPLIAQAR